MFGFPIEYIKYCFDWAKKALIVVAVLFIVFQLFVYFIHSDNQYPKVNTHAQLKNNINATINYLEKQSNQGKAMAKAYADNMCYLTGEACSGPTNGGITGLMAKSLVWPLANPPSSGIVVVENTLQNAGFIPKTYAATTEGVGFASLAPFRKIWLIFRNLIFMIMVLVVIVIGFMIMFRAKINPQTVISIENALPKIVVAMLLVTFSYAIAGFMIDLMYIVMGLLAALFQQININISVDKYIYGQGPTGIFDALNFTSTMDIANALQGILPETLKNVLDGLAIFAFNLGIFKLGNLVAPNKVAWNIDSFKQLNALGKAADDAKKTAADTSNGSKGGLGLGWISLIMFGVSLLLQVGLNLVLNGIEVTFFINFILQLTLLIVWFRLFFMLINTYIQILLLVFFSPFFMAAEAFPGKGAFTTWLKNMFYHLITYPLFVLVILIGNTLTTYTSDSSSLILWQPPFLGGINSQTFAVMVAGVLIFSAPNIIKMVKEMTGIKPISAGQGVGPGTFFAGGAALVTTMTGAAGGAQSLFSRSALARNLFLGKFTDGQYDRPIGRVFGNLLDPNAAQRKYYQEQAIGSKEQTHDRTHGGSPETPQTDDQRLQALGLKRGTG